MVTYFLLILIQCPHLSRIKKMIPRKVSSIAMAIHTPCKPNEGARAAANVIRTAHIEKRFISAGFIVSPVPRNTP